MTTLDCGHGAATGSVASADSGCDAVDVSLPAGTAAKPLFATVRSGRGKVRATLHPASFVGSFELRGSHGPIDVTFPATRGATITIVAETGDDMIVHLPADFAADVLTLETSGDKIDVGAFPEVQSGKGRGVAGQGAKSMTLRTTGRITLARD